MTRLIFNCGWEQIHHLSLLVWFVCMFMNLKLFQAAAAPWVHKLQELLLSLGCHFSNLCLRLLLYLIWAGLLQETFERAKAWVKELQRQASPNIVIALAGNKADLAERRLVEFEVTLLSGTTLVERGMVWRYQVIHWCTREYTPV